MNDVVSQMSGRATENRTMSGSLSQPMASGSSMTPNPVSSSFTMPKLSIIRNRHSRPATTGAIMSG